MNPVLDPKFNEEKTRQALRNAKSKFAWVPFHTVSATSEMQGTNLEELSLNHYEPSERAWECSRYVDFPQEVIIRLNHRSEVAHVIIMAKENRFIPECEIYVGDGISGSFDDVDYRLAGTAISITSAPK